MPFDRNPVAMSRPTRLEVDLHVHSEASYDGHEPVEVILEHAADIGLDAVVVTDHDVIDASLEAAELAPEYGLVGIPGVEVSTADGHLLAIGVEELPATGRPMAETVAEVRAAGGVAVVPHPFQRTRHGIRKRTLKGLDPDAIETYNAWLFTGYRNRRARRYAARYGYPAVGGSDAHSLLTVGRAYTEVDVEGSIGEVDGEDVVAAIRAGETAIRGQRASLQRSTGHYAKAAVRKTAHAGRRAVLKSGGGASRAIHRSTVGAGRAIQKSGGVRRAVQSGVPFR